MLSTLRNAFPTLDVLAKHGRRDYVSDATAGATTAVMLIPQAMAYAMLAGLPPIYGLYASVAPLVAYALLGTSRQLAVGPVAMVSIMVAASVGELAAPGSDAYVGYAIALAALVGVMQLVMGLARMGFLVNFLSHPVISGFTSAAALIIAGSQLKHLFGISVERGPLHHTLLSIAAKIDDTHLPTLGIGLAGIVALVVLAKKAPRFPRALFVVGASALAVHVFGLAEGGTKIVGDVPEGLPTPALPTLSIETLAELWPTAAAIALVGFMESVSVAKAFARRNRYEIQANRELLGLGAANVVGSLFSGYPVTGGFSRTAVNAQAGAKSTFASLVTAGLVALTLALFTPLFHDVPRATLAAVIVSAVLGLVDLHEVRRLWKVDRSELALLGATFVGTLALGIEEGILLGVVSSLGWFVFRTMRPHTAVLGRLPGDDAVYRNVKRHPSAETLPGVLVLRVDAQLYFGNVAHLKETIANLDAESKAPLRALVLDASAINRLDSSALSALEELAEDYGRRDLELYIAGAKGPVLDVMRRGGLIEELGPDRFHLSISSALREIASRREPEPSALPDGPLGPTEAPGQTAA